MVRALRIVGAADPAGLEAAAGLDTLEDVLRHGFAAGWELLDVVVQDELTHDVIVRGPAFLVFDTT